LPQTWSLLDNHPEAWPFQKPVEEWYAPGYHDIIKVSDVCVCVVLCAKRYASCFNGPGQNKKTTSAKKQETSQHRFCVIIAQMNNFSDGEKTCCWSTLSVRNCFVAKPFLCMQTRQHTHFEADGTLSDSPVATRGLWWA